MATKTPSGTRSVRPDVDHDDATPKVSPKSIPDVEGDGLKDRIEAFIVEHPLLNLFGFEVLRSWILPFAWDMLKGEAKTHIEERAKRHANKFTFGAIMAALQSKPETKLVHDKVIAFMLWFEDTFPDRLDDMSHFKNNVANIGEDSEINDSVQFLCGFVGIDDPLVQVSWLETMGFIGPNALNYREHVLEFAKHVLVTAYGRTLPHAIARMLDLAVGSRELAARVANYIDGRLVDLDAVFTAAPGGGGPNLLDRTEVLRANARGRLNAVLR